MPRVAQIAQADIARVLRAFRSLGTEAEVRLMTDGSVVIRPAALGPSIEQKKFDEEEQIRL